MDKLTMKKCSLLQQVKETILAEPSNVLYIGIEYNQVPKILRIFNHNCITLDIDKELHPDVIATVERLPFKDSVFSTIVCCQVLEHLPYSSFSDCLDELKRVGNVVILSLPERVKIKRDYILFRRKRLNHPYHQWEIGYDGYPLSKIKKEIKKRFKIVRTYRLREKPYHRFFILEKYEQNIYTNSNISNINRR